MKMIGEEPKKQPKKAQSKRMAEIVRRGEELLLNDEREGRFT